MSECSQCEKWTRKRRRVYGDGTEVVHFEAKDDMGLCEYLEMQTRPGFACCEFVGAPGYDHVVTEAIEGPAWQHWKMGKCPDCEGRGSGKEGGACGRCVGTGQVRFYDDGYVGEEKTRKHRIELEHWSSLAIEQGETTYAGASALAPIAKPDVSNTGLL